MTIINLCVPTRLVHLGVFFVVANILIILIILFIWGLVIFIMLEPEFFCYCFFKCITVPIPILVIIGYRLIMFRYPLNKSLTHKNTLSSNIILKYYSIQLDVFF